MANTNVVNPEFYQNRNEEDTDIIIIDKPTNPTTPITSYTYEVCVKASDTQNPIPGASVSLLIGNETGQLKDTDNNGIATFTRNNGGNSYNFTVFKRGYYPNNGSVERNSLATVELIPEPTMHYYGICVKDASTSNPIKDVTVSIAGQLGSYTTDSNGIYVYATSDGDGSDLLFNLSKNGYDSLLNVSVPSVTLESTATSNPKTVELNVAVYVDYYYVIQVKDDLGLSVKDAAFKLNNNISGSSSYSEIISVQDEDAYYDVLETVKSIISGKSGISTSTISVNKSFSGLGISETVFTSIIDTIENAFDLTSISGITLDSTVENLIEYIQTNSTRPIGKTIFKTNDNGLISIDFGSYNVHPRAKFASNYILPPGYTVYNNEALFGSVPATTNPTTPGITFTVKSTIDNSKYFRFKVLDRYTNQPVRNANVVYHNGDEFLYAETTDNNGFSGYKYGQPTLDVNISKDVYDNLNSSYEGSSSSEEYYRVILTPKYSIRVVDSDNEAPRANVLVKISYRSETGLITLGTYKSNENGYIETQEIGIYTSGDKYIASAVDYNVVTNIVAAHNILKISSEHSDDDGENEFEQFNELSVNSIKNHIDIGNKELKATSASNNVSYSDDDFRINIIDPDSVHVYDVFAPTPVIISNEKKNIIGSVDIKLKKNINDLRLKIINRYSGYYNPIFKDILFYNNFEYNAGDDENKDMRTCPFSNTDFDIMYKDNYGSFGIINNMWFHKVNDNKNLKIINTLTPYYPLIGQYALDSRDYNIFSTNWDRSYYTRQLDTEHSETCTNISSMKNGLCLFGSKYLNTPNRIEIYGFTLGEDSDWKGEWNDDWITSPDGCPGEMMFKEVNNNSVDFYFFFKKRILRYFQEQLKDEFEKYIGDKFSYGMDGIDDDIKEYVIKNILKLYRLDKIRMFVRRTKKGQHNSKIENDYTKYLEYDRTSGNPSVEEYFKEKGYLEYFKRRGFLEVNTVTVSKMNRDDFDRKVVYNLKSGMKEEFAFSFVLKKI